MPFDFHGRGKQILGRYVFSKERREFQTSSLFMTPFYFREGFVVLMLMMEVDHKEYHKVIRKPTFMTLHYTGAEPPSECSLTSYK